MVPRIFGKAYYGNYYTDSTKFCTVINMGGPNTRPTNQRWRTAAIFGKSKNRDISAMTNFDEIWQDDAELVSGAENLNF